MVHGLTGLTSVSERPATSVKYTFATRLNCSYSERGKKVNTVYLAVLVRLFRKVFLHWWSELFVKTVRTSSELVPVDEEAPPDACVRSWFSWSGFIPDFRFSGFIILSPSSLSWDSGVCTISSKATKAAALPTPKVLAFLTGGPAFNAFDS